MSASTPDGAQGPGQGARRCKAASADRIPPGTQRGAAAVEFALVCGLLCVLLMGAVELGRAAWLSNAAVEATRHGARLAVVCDVAEPGIAQRMAARLPGLRPDQVRIDYLATGLAPNACSAADCEAVRVAIVDFEHRTFVPFLARTLALPPMTTTLRRESMDGTANAACE